MSAPRIRPFEDPDLPWAESLLGGDFAGRLQARLGEVHDVLACPGLVAELDGDPAGILTYRRDGPDVEVAYLEVVAKRRGVGTCLIEALVERTAPARLWLVTTNDNLDALRFYQRRGFSIAEIRLGAVDQSRRTVKPTIPEIGRFGIPVRDEIVLERVRP